ADEVFAGILKIPSNKIRYDETKDDYPVSRIIDSVPTGKTADLAIHLITPDHPQYDNPKAVLAQSMAKKEMQIILAADTVFQQDLRLYFQTDTYCRQQEGQVDNAQIQRIISEKQYKNTDRKKLIREKLITLLSTAELYVMGDLLKSGSQDPVQRIQSGFQSLVKKAYPKLRFLGNHHYSEADINATLNPNDAQALFSGNAAQLNEAERAMDTFLQLEFAGKVPVSVRALVEEFQYSQFGWSEWGILATLARLFAREKVELLQGHTVKNKNEVQGFLIGRRDFSEVRVKPILDAKSEDLDALRALFQALFHQALTATGGKDGAIQFKQKLPRVVQTLETGISSRKAQLPFLSDVEPFVAELRSITDKEWDYLLTGQEAYKDRLNQLFQEELDPLREFLASSQPETWEGLKNFAESHANNLREIGKADELEDFQAKLKEIPYKNDILRTL
ncbi:MAG: hypothetical protein KAH21_11845, partial [Spirochaetaceae bacterium]|nr:hypothetical protein [Spirochaetaceae bacterium]